MKGYLVVEVAGFIDLGSVHHGLELLLVESVGLSGQDLGKVILGDGSLVFWIEELESVDNDVLGVRSVELIGKHRKEDGEVDSSWSLGHHFVELRVLDGHDTEGSVGGAEILLVDETVAVGVDHAEGLLELLDLRLLELRENVRGSCLLLSLLWCHFKRV